MRNRLELRVLCAPAVKILDLNHDLARFGDVVPLAVGERRAKTVS